MKIKESNGSDDIFLEKVLDIDRQVYSEDMQGSLQSVGERYRKHPTSFLLLEDEDNIVGYLCYFPICDSLYQRMIFSHEPLDDNITANEIRDYSDKTHLFVISIVIMEAYRDGKAIVLLLDEWKTKIKKKIEEGYGVESISGYTVSEDGRKFVKRLRFEKIGKNEGEYQLYSMTKEEIERWIYG